MLDLAVDGVIHVFASNEVSLSEFHCSVVSGCDDDVAFVTLPAAEPPLPERTTI